MSTESKPSAAGSEIVGRQHFYINIVLLNKDEALREKVQEKTGIVISTGLFGKAASAVAAKAVSDDSLINKLSDSLMTKVPETIGEMGIHATVTKSFQKKLYVVLRMELGEIDKLTLLRSGKGPEFARTFETLLQCLNTMGIEGALSSIDANIYQKVRSGMMEKFGQMIPSKMAENGMIVSCDVLPPEEQADFFFAKLATIE